MSYNANTDDQRRQMLEAIGVSSIEELFADIPEHLRAKSFNLHDPLSEQEVREILDDLTLAAGGADLPTHDLAGQFLGGGFYDHYVPAAVDALASRSEFYTAYTPYQPEASQGTLQAIYEYQSMICRLTGMPAANASLYDGGSAIYEAVAMALRIRKRDKVIVDETVHPIYRRMLATYTANLGIEIVTTGRDETGRVGRRDILEALDKDTAAVVVANPNFFGICDDFTDLADACHDNKALLIVSCYPISLGILKTPGEMGADIVVGEGQSLGLGLNFGGPWLGFMATTEKHMRKMPGRIAGKTIDAEGNEGFVLTLQAREQHIRRDKATSNICTNQGLCALRATIYMSLLGKQGMVELATQCADRAWATCQMLCEADGVSRRFPDAPFFNEFVLDLPIDSEAFAERWLGGFIPLACYYEDMDNAVLLSATERTQIPPQAALEHLEEVLENADADL
jgi:glycine dehydrogenase subunit 1